jgi:hypothetical protein
MKLYYAPAACSQAPHIVAREAGLPIELANVRFPDKVTDDGEKLTDVNPKGAVPTLRLDDGSVLTENAVILQYLADQAPDSAASACRPTGAARPAVIDIRPFASLGHADHGWLDARHHFSFANYHDPARMGWGAIRVWNDDEIAARSASRRIPHRDMEIITYVRTGAITHQDSMGNKGRTGAGDVQVMSAGTGVTHAEYNLEDEADDPVPDLGRDRQARRRAELGRDAVPQGRPRRPLHASCRDVRARARPAGDDRRPALGRVAGPVSRRRRPCSSAAARSPSCPGIPEISLDPELALVLFLPPLLMDGAYYTAFGRFPPPSAGHPVAGGRRGAVHDPRRRGGGPYAGPGAALGGLLRPRARSCRRPTPSRRARCSSASAAAAAAGAARGRKPAQRRHRPGPLPVRRRGDAQRRLRRRRGGGQLPPARLGRSGGRGRGRRAWIAVMRRMTDETLVVATATCCAGPPIWPARRCTSPESSPRSRPGSSSAGISMSSSPAKMRMQGSAFWRTLVFGLEALVFILIGFSLRGVLERVGRARGRPDDHGGAGARVVAAVLLARFAWVFGSDALLTLLRRAGLKRARARSAGAGGILAWTGMRGVVTLAVALTLPAQMPGRDLMLVAPSRSSSSR